MLDRRRGRIASTKRRRRHHRQESSPGDSARAQLRARGCLICETFAGADARPELENEAGKRADEDAPLAGHDHEPDLVLRVRVDLGPHDGEDAVGLSLQAIRCGRRVAGVSADDDGEGASGGGGKWASARMKSPLSEWAELSSTIMVASSDMVGASCASGRRRSGDTSRGGSRGRRRRGFDPTSPLALG